MAQAKAFGDIKRTYFDILKVEKKNSEKMRAR